MENEVITEEVVDNADDIFADVVIEQPRPVGRRVAIGIGIGVLVGCLAYGAYKLINTFRDRREAREQGPVDVECYEDEE